MILSASFISDHGNKTQGNLLLSCKLRILSNGKKSLKFNEIYWILKKRTQKLPKNPKIKINHRGRGYEQG